MLFLSYKKFLSNDSSPLSVVAVNEVVFHPSADQTAHRESVPPVQQLSKRLHSACSVANVTPLDAKLRGSASMDTAGPSTASTAVASYSAPPTDKQHDGHFNSTATDSEDYGVVKRVKTKKVVVQPIVKPKASKRSVAPTSDSDIAVGPSIKRSKPSQSGKRRVEGYLLSGIIPSTRNCDEKGKVLADIYVKGEQLRKDHWNGLRDAIEWECVNFRCATSEYGYEIPRMQGGKENRIENITVFNQSEFEMHLGSNPFLTFEWFDLWPLLKDAGWICRESASGIGMEYVYTAAKPSVAGIHLFKSKIALVRYIARYALHSHLPFVTLR